jgi:hypothetical protein
MRDSNLVQPVPAIPSPWDGFSWGVLLLTNSLRDEAQAIHFVAKYDMSPSRQPYPQPDKSAKVVLVDAFVQDDIARKRKAYPDPTGKRENVEFDVADVLSTYAAWHVLNSIGHGAQLSVPSGEQITKLRNTYDTFKLALESLRRNVAPKIHPLLFELSNTRTPAAIDRASFSQWDAILVKAAGGVSTEGQWGTRELTLNGSTDVDVFRPSHQDAFRDFIWVYKARPAIRNPVRDLHAIVAQHDILRSSDDVHGDPTIAFSLVRVPSKGAMQFYGCHALQPRLCYPILSRSEIGFAINYINARRWPASTFEKSDSSVGPAQAEQVLELAPMHPVERGIFGLQTRAGGLIGRPTQLPGIAPSRPVQRRMSALKQRVVGEVRRW